MKLRGLDSNIRFVIYLSVSHVGCECSDSWEGPHCEFEKGTFYVTEPAIDLYDPKTMGLGVGLVAVVLFVCLLGFLYYRHRRDTTKQRKMKQRQQQQQQQRMGSGARRAPHKEII